MSKGKDDHENQFRYVQDKLREVCVAAIDRCHAALFAADSEPLSFADLKTLMYVLRESAFLFNNQFVVLGDDDKIDGIMDDDDDEDGDGDEKDDGFRPFM